MGQEKDGGEGASFFFFFFFFAFFTWLWWLVVNEFLMMFLKSGSYLLGLMQCLLLLGLCAGENRGGRRETV